MERLKAVFNVLLPAMACALTSKGRGSSVVRRAHFCGGAVVI